MSNQYYKFPYNWLFMAVSIVLYHIVTMWLFLIWSSWTDVTLSLANTLKYTSFQSKQGPIAKLSLHIFVY